MRGATYTDELASNDGFISIHAPREGSDAELLRTDDDFKQFQSTLPVRGATIRVNKGPLAPRISIHAPREGSDLAGQVDLHLVQLDFNPRSP